MSEVTVLDRDRVELATLENAHEISYTNRINEAPTASFALPVDDDKNDFCEIGRYVRLEDDDGKIGLYRINSPRLNTDETQKYYDLFHVVDTLNDQMFPGKSSVNDGLTQLTKSVEEGDTTLPVKDPSQFSAGDMVIIAGRNQSEKVTVDSIFGGGNNAKVKMEVRPYVTSITRDQFKKDYPNVDIEGENIIQCVDRDECGIRSLERWATPSNTVKDQNYHQDQKLILKSGIKNDYSAGTTVAIPISINNAINKVLDKQEIKNWQLGICDFSINDLVFQFHDSTLLDALFRIGKKIGEKYVWTWDTDSYPWTLNLKDPVETKPVGYIDRGVNLQNINLKRDPSKMATRLYPYGTDGISIKPVKGREYIQDDIAIGKWGIREKVVRTNHNTPSALLTAAENILDQRKEPQSTFQISAADLSDITGEETHRYEIGDWVQITDQENDIKIKEILVSKSKNGLQENPAQINLEFANKTQFFKTPDEQLSSFRHDLENEVTETSNNFDQIRANLFGDIEDIQDFINDTRVDIDNERARLDNVKDYLEDKRIDLRQDHQELVDLSESLHEQVEADITNLSITQGQIQGVVSDNQGNISVLTQRANSIESTVTDNQGNISDIRQTAKSIESRVTNTEGDISDLTQTASSIDAAVKNNKGSIGDLSVRATSIEASVDDNQGNIGDLQVTAQNITASVEDNAGNIGTLQTTAQSIQASVENNEGDIGTLQTTATSIEANVSDLEGNFSDLQLEVDNISATVSDHENRVSQLEINVGSIQTTVDSQGDTISQMTQTADAFDFTVYGSGNGTATMPGDDIISQINLSSSGVVIEGDNIDISGSNITVSGDQITLNGNTNVTSDFNVGGNVYLNGYGDYWDGHTWHIMVPYNSPSSANFAVAADGTVIAKNVRQMESEDGDTIVEDGDYLKPSAGYLENQIIWDHNVDGASPTDFEPIDLSNIVGSQEALLVIYTDYLDSGWYSCIEILPREEAWVRSPGGCDPARGVGHAKIGSANEREILITTTDKDGKIAFGSKDAHQIDLFLQFWIPLGNVA